jgi:hypothetical protein
MAAPVLQAHTMRRGNMTRQTCGEVPLAQFMVVSGTGITSWSITLTGGTAGHWNTAGAIQTGGSSPTPTATGDTAELNGGPYTFNVTATNGSGTSNTAVLTINIATDVVTVSKPADLSGSGSTGLRQPAFSAALGGKTIEFARGCYAAFNGNGAATYDTTKAGSFQNHTTHTGRIAVTSEDQTLANRSVLGRLTMINNQRMDVSAITFEGYLTGATSNSAQNVAMFQITYQSSQGACNDITFSDIDFAAPAGHDPPDWRTAISIGGNAASPFQKQVGIDFDNIRISRVTDGLTAFAVTDCVWNNITVDRFSSNAFYLSGAGNARNSLTDFVSVRPFANSLAPLDHRDHMQVGQTVATSTENYDSNYFEHIVLILAGGDSPAQGPYYDDVSISGSTPTGRFQVNTTLVRMLTDAPTFQGIHLDGGSGWDVEFNTSIRGQATAAANASAGIGVPNIGASSIVAASGIFQSNVGQSIGSGIPTYWPSYATNNYMIDEYSTPPSGSVWSEAARAAYYVPYFADPGRVIDYDNLTAREIAAEVKLAYAALLDGPLKNVDGTYKGAIFPDGTWNDGSIYQATPPASYTLSCPQTTTPTGAAVTLTVQLDAAANQTVTITPHISGVTGTFSTPAVIGVGATTTTFDFTPTSTGTASITTTNNRSLPDPSAVLVTVTSPVGAPTLYTQAAPSAYVMLGVSIPITYVLDAVAVADVTITPACTTGTFTPTTIVISTGQVSGQVAFVPTSAGTATLTATNNRSLSNPSSLVLTATACNHGQLLSLGVR